MWTVPAQPVRVRPPSRRGCQVPHVTRRSRPSRGVPRKEVIQPQVPLRLPCYDFTPVAELTVVGCPLLRGRRTTFGSTQRPWCDGRCVQGPGTYSPRRADARLLAIPTSCRRVADDNPN